MKALSVLVDECTGLGTREALQLARARMAGQEENITGTATEEDARDFGRSGTNRLQSHDGESVLEWTNRALKHWRCLPGVVMFDIVQSYEDDGKTLFSESYVFAGWVPSP